MIELLEFAVQPSNLIYTGLLILVLFYWLVVLLGALDMGSLDLDLDLDGDVDVDMDTDADISTSAGGGFAWLNKALVFFNLGKVPLMFFLSFLILPMWILSILENSLLFQNASFLISLIFVIPNLIVGLFIAKVLTMPFIGFFERLNHTAHTSEDLVGQICRIALHTTDDGTGQAEVFLGGSHFLVGAKTLPGVEIQKNEQALVIQYDSDSDTYLVEPYSTAP